MLDAEGGQMRICGEVPGGPRPPEEVHQDPPVPLPRDEYQYVRPAQPSLRDLNRVRDGQGIPKDSWVGSYAKKAQDDDPWKTDGSWIGQE